MNLREWMAATNPHASKLMEPERQARRAMRARVFAAAQTTYGTVINALHRGRIGPDLMARLELATTGEPVRIIAADGLQSESGRRRR